MTSSDIIIHPRVMPAGAPQPVQPVPLPDLLVQGARHHLDLLRLPPRLSQPDQGQLGQVMLPKHQLR